MIIWASLSTVGVMSFHSAKASLADLQVTVGGLIEIVEMPNCDMVVNEEGLLDDSPLNVHASRMTGRLIMGNVAFTGTPDRFGNTRKLSASGLRFLQRYEEEFL